MASVPFHQSDSLAYSTRGSPWLSLAAAALLALMTVLMFLSSRDDSANSDDNVALVSGYSYLRTQEYRLEPQNPPLIKDLAAAPLLFMNLREPWEHRAWIGDKDPDALGRVFLYHLGNDADAMLRAARAPMILFAAAFGAVLFFWTRKHFGAPTALLTLFFYTFSPTFLAHGRHVATDLGATAGFFIGLTAFLRMLKQPSAKNIWLAGLALGFALLTKFSTIALLPIFLLLAAVWAMIQHAAAGRSLMHLRRLAGGGRAIALRLPSRLQIRALGRSLGRVMGVIAIALLLIYAVYLHHVWSFSPQMQREIAETHRQTYLLGGTAKDIMLWASDQPLLQPWAEYFLGLLVALKASRWGQPVFFLGQVYSTGQRSYFPIAYLLKEPLALHFLTLVALAFLLWSLRRSEWRRGQVTKWARSHFTEFAFLVMLAVYWAAMLRSHMNIGVRHLLPAFPFMFILVARQIVRMFEGLGKSADRSVLRRQVARVALGALLGWQAITVLRVYPSYLAYFNELAGGPDGGWRYLNDSNLDWGQDVKRLAQFVELRGLPGIHADYFGPADAFYYFREKYQGPVGCGPPPKGWVAVSAMFYPGAPWNPECDYRRFLPIETLKARIGYSIFVFHVE